MGSDEESSESPARRPPPPSYSSSEGEEADSSSDEEPPQPQPGNPAKPPDPEEEEEDEEEEEEDDPKEEVEEDEEDVEEESSSSDEEHPKPQKTANPPPESDEDEESASDSEPEPEPEPEPANNLAKPAATAESGHKKNDNNEKPKFKRVWSLSDEITLLNHLLDYQTSQGRPIFATIVDMRGFLPLVSKSLTFSVDAGQLMSKVRRLKERYQHALARVTDKKGKQQQPKFATAHDASVYGISGKIWGEGSLNPVVNDEAPPPAPAPARPGGMKRKRGGKAHYPLLNEAVKKMDNGAVIEGAIQKISPKDLAGLERKLRTVECEEIKIQARKMDILKQIYDVALKVFDQPAEPSS